MGITDGTVWCSLCGEDKTGCDLCGTAPLTGKSEAARAREQRAIDEEWGQSRQIDREARKRRGFL